MNSFNWHNIISLNNSQNDAFEELVCQIAKKEAFTKKKDFIKIGNPDAGVECYVVLEDGREIGFQAKWFLSTPQETQWTQIEKSFKTALEKHPKITVYYVAIPLDRADPRINNQKSFMDKWNEKTKKWSEYAKDTYDRNINFIYWGSSELIERLSKKENEGLKSFFFNELDLSDEWLKDQNELAISDLGKRYIPEINVELDIVKNFDVLSLNKSFKNKVDKLYHEMIVSYRDLSINGENLESFLDSLGKKILELELLYNSIIFEGVSKIDFREINLLLESIKDDVVKLDETLRKLNEQEIENKKLETFDGYRQSTSYDNSIRTLAKFLSALHEFIDFFDSNAFGLINTPFMILKGDAGIGKSHLLADIINQRLEDDSNSIFLLGQYFREDKDPWNQIFSLLGLNTNKEKLLGALNAKAESQNKRLIIFIDAINEGKGRNFWKDFLIGFIETIKRYEWLGLVLSVRTSYFDLVVPQEVFERNLAISITHFGFEGVEYNASKIFFQNYNILQPSIPLLHPEFSNPLFLKLFCDGLYKKGLNYIPEGYEGITKIINFFIEGIEDKLSKKYSNIKSLNIVQKVIDVLIPMIIKNQAIYYEEALETVIREVTSKYGVNHEFLDDLIIEGLLTKNLFYDDKKDYIYFAYERFEDHLKAKYLLDNYLDISNPAESFEKEPLSNYFNDKNINYNRGLIDALSIQLPEKSSVELIDMVNQNDLIIESFLDSLLWRRNSTITSKIKDKLIKNISNEYFSEKIYNILFSLAPNPNHSLSGDFLFDYLSGFSMRDRDILLSSIMNRIYLSNDVNSISRLIDWAWSNEDKNHICDESILLTVTTLSWFLTSSNRKLRDYTTKSMISILQNRVNVLIYLLQKFENINEPYIYERLFAVAYGVVIRVETNDSLNELGEYIYNVIFNKDEVYPHILLRDYAKNTIDYITYLNVDLDIEFEKVNPPYKSSLPEIKDLPTEQEIKAYREKDVNYHIGRILSSMMTEYGHDNKGGYGDFGRYILGSALSSFECREHEQLLSNFACEKIFEEYGYDAKLFDVCESQISDINRWRGTYSRNDHIIERIGKKYQWIAFYDLLARVSDNFKMFDSYGARDKKELPYKGSFEPNVRNIDPTLIIRRNETTKKENGWWIPKVEISWNIDSNEWTNCKKDLPKFNDCIEVKDDHNQLWIALSTFPTWHEPLVKGYEKSDIKSKELWYQLRGYFIEKRNKSNYIAWAKKQNFWNNWMPSENDWYQMFNRESYWSDAYKYLEEDKIWLSVSNYSGGECFEGIALSTEKYYWEDGHDYSKNETLSNFLKPSKILFDKLKLKYSSKEEGVFLDQDNNIICFDSIIYDDSFNSLLIRKDVLENFLNENNLSLVWTLVGQKLVRLPNYKYLYMNITGYSYFDESFIGELKTIKL